jgi:phage tail-like protein
MNMTRSVSLDLTPMRLPETTGSIDVPTLLVNPGESSEIMLKIHNQELHQDYRVSLKIEGDFPLDWCQIATEGPELERGASQEAVLAFQVPIDFFEGTGAANADRPRQIDYRGRVVLTVVNPETQIPTFILADFALMVRPETKYLKFLPGIYQEVDFIGRFVKIFEQAFTPAVQTHDALWAYLDPRLTSQAMLPFLAHWVAWQPDAAIPIARQRRLIHQAMEIYRWRGTKRGLLLYLHLATGLALDDESVPESARQITIREYSSRGALLGQTQLGVDSMLGGGRAFYFSVHLRSRHPIDRALVQRIIDQEKPAFCHYDLSIETLEPASTAAFDLNQLTSA